MNEHVGRVHRTRSTGRNRAKKKKKEKTEECGGIGIALCFVVNQNGFRFNQF